MLVVVTVVTVLVLGTSTYLEFNPIQPYMPRIRVFLALMREPAVGLEGELPL